MEYATRVSVLTPTVKRVATVSAVLTVGFSHAKHATPILEDHIALVRHGGKTHGQEGSDRGYPNGSDSCHHK